MNKKERVHHPTHYNRGVEMWDYAHSHNLDFFEGNIVKYITRWKDKNGIEDLKKACKKNTPEIRIATPFFKPSQNKT